MTERDAADDPRRALPETYALALRLQAEGLDATAIARVLDIERESVPPLLALAHAKLAALDPTYPPLPQPPSPPTPDR